MSLRIKLLFLSIILALIPLGIAGRSMIQITRIELKSSGDSNLINAANQIVQDIEDFYTYTWLTPLKLIKKTVESENLGLNEKVSLLTEAMKISDIVLLQISVEGYASPLVFTRDDFSKQLPPDISLQLSFDPARILEQLKGQDVFVGGLDYLREADAWLLTVFLSLSLDKKSGQSAILAARINLERLKERIEKQNVRQTITLIDAEGHKIFVPQRTDISHYEIVKAVKKVFADKPYTIPAGVYSRPDGEKMLGAYAFPKGLEMAVIVEQSEADAYRAVRDMETKLFRWIIGGFILAVIAAAFVSVSLTRPLRRLMQAVRVIAEGDLTVQIRDKGRKDEIGELAAAFDRMVGDLDRYIRELTETTKAKERAEGELKLARDIQQSFLPKTFPDMERIEVWGKCDPAREVGGDYFDFFQIDEENYGMVIGDVSGKGVPAALFMAVSRTLFRILSSTQYSPERVLTEFNDRLVGLDQGANMFITVFYGVFNTKTGRFLYSTAGHNMPYIKGGDTAFRMLPPMEQTMVAGMMDGILMESAEIQLNAGDIVALYTDGMTESINGDKEEFGEQRLASLLDIYAGLSAQEMCEKLIEDVQVFQTGQPQFDDMTLFILKVRNEK
ncbi:MAG: hypothetical protein BWK80_54025 [Desulfobacteraceae bacterium IS3]|nr:MAG: hypothetical protein BWK80_54025 [Desulfobacteraceae bacterium IS3]